MTEKNLGEKLAQFRKENNITQEELASICFDKGKPYQIGKEALQNQILQPLRRYVEDWVSELMNL